MKKTRLITMLSAFALAAAGAIGLSSLKEVKKAESVEAASVPAGVYVDISACQWNTWGADLSNIKAHFFDGGTGYTTWPGDAVESVSINGKTYGYAEVPSGAKQVIFNAWGGNSDQNKTGDLTIPTDGKVLFTVTSYNTSSVQTGSWSNIDIIVPTTSASSPSSSTARVFINNDSAHEDWKSAQLGIRAWGGNASLNGGKAVSSHVYNVNWFDGNYGSVYYAYADIPTDCTAFQVVRVSGDSATASVWSYSDSITKSNDSFAYIYYLVGGSTNSMSLSAGGAKDDHAGNVLLQKLLEAYDTCSNSNYNGFGQASKLNTNFYSHADDWAKAQLATSRNGTSMAISAHFDAMIARAAGRSPSGSPFIGIINEQTQNITIIVIISLVSVTAIGGFFFIKKRKSI